MFKLVDRYIARQVIVASLLVLFLLVCLRSMFSLLDELGNLDKGNYQLADAFLYVGLMIPARLLEFFPMSVLIGALFGLGGMAANSELTILRAAGMTTWNISWSSIKASLVLVLMVIVIGEWVSPITTKSAFQLRTAAISGGELTVSKTGLWAKTEGEIIQLGNVLNDGRLADITLYKIADGNRIASIIKAESAFHSGEHWVLQDIQETQFLDDKVVTKFEKDRLWLNPLQQAQIESLTLEPESLNLSGLLSYLDYLHQNGLETQIFELAFWHKLFQPLSIAVMMFLAASFVFGPMRDVSMGARILAGVMLGFAFHLANQSFGPISLAFALWPFFGAVFPLVLFASLGYWLMARIK